jgi:hypothetical protein
MLAAYARVLGEALERVVAAVASGHAEVALGRRRRWLGSFGHGRPYVATGVFGLELIGQTERAIVGMAIGAAVADWRPAPQNLTRGQTGSSGALDFERPRLRTGPDTHAGAERPETPLNRRVSGSGTFGPRVATPPNAPASARRCAPALRSLRSLRDMPPPEERQLPGGDTGRRKERGQPGVGTSDAGFSFGDIALCCAGGGSRQPHPVVAPEESSRSSRPLPVRRPVLTGRMLLTIDQVVALISAAHPTARVGVTLKRRLVQLRVLGPAFALCGNSACPCGPPSGGCTGHCFVLDVTRTRRRPVQVAVAVHVPRRRPVISFGSKGCL